MTPDEAAHATEYNNNKSHRDYRLAHDRRDEEIGATSTAATRQGGPQAEGRLPIKPVLMPHELGAFAVLEVARSPPQACFLIKKCIAIISSTVTPITIRRWDVTVCREG